MKVYKFWTASSSIRNLSQGLLKLSTLDELNDPFEFAHIDMRDRALRKAFRAWRDEKGKSLAIMALCESHYNPLM